MALKPLYIVAIALAAAGGAMAWQASNKPGIPATRSADTPRSPMQEPPPRPSLDSTKSDRLPAPIPTPVAASYAAGQSVEIERSGFWHPCRVTTVDQVNGGPVIRADCEGLPEQERVLSQEYISGRAIATGMRPATGRVGSDLSIGKITCYDSSGNRDDVTFLVTDWGKYTDIWGENTGTFQRKGANIVFSGGHLDGMSGREFVNNGFKFGTGITCSGALS